MQTRNGAATPQTSKAGQFVRIYNTKIRNYTFIPKLLHISEFYGLYYSLQIVTKHNLQMLQELISIKCQSCIIVNRFPILTQPEA